jgi:tetratricopeptide (TPR) repeat protein
MSKPASDPNLDGALAAAARHHHEGRLREAESIYKDVLRKAPDHGDALHLLGLVAYQSGRPGDAVELIRKALATDDANAAYHDNIGLAYRTMGQIDAALHHARRAAVLDRASPGPQFNLACVLDAAGHLDEAVSAYRRALAVMPNHAEAHNGLANALIRQGRTEQAITHYRRALSLRPGYAEAHYNLGSLLALQGQLEEAANHYRAALTARTAPDIQAALGIVLLRLGKGQEALPLLEKAHAEAPTDMNTLFFLAGALRSNGRSEEAIAHYRKLLSAHPGMAEAHCNLGNLLLERGAPADARANFDAALALQPNSWQALLGRGRCDEAEGDQDAATVWFRKAIGTGDPMAAKFLTKVPRRN